MVDYAYALDIISDFYSSICYTLRVISFFVDVC